MLLAERIERLLKYRDAAAAHDPNLQQELRMVMAELGKPITRPNCPDCLYDAMIFLRKLDLTTMKKTVAKLKTDSYIRAFGESNSYDNTNLTDAIARKILKEYPEMKDSFKTLPPEKPEEGDEDFEDPNALQKQEEEVKQQQSLAAENEQLRRQLQALQAQQTLPEVSPVAPTPAPEPEKKANEKKATTSKDAK